MDLRPPPARRQRPPAAWGDPAAVVVAVIALVAITGAALLQPRGDFAGPAEQSETPAAQPTAVDGELPGDVAIGRQQAPAIDPLDPPAGRVPVPPSHPEENPHAIVAAQVSPDYASGVVFDQQVLLGDVALPWRYWLDPSVPERVDEPSVHAAVAAWDDVEGSRWASRFEGYRAAPAPVADGHSTIFLEAECAELTTANAYLFTDGGLGVDRYGTSATQILEADIGICPRVTSDAQLERAIRHEVGHVVGLGHLCDPGDACWLQPMGEGPNACAVMFWQARGCQTALSPGERAAVSALYPTLRRLTGPSPADTTARAAFAVTEDGSAPVVVVVAEGVAPGVAAAAAALAGRAAGAVLIGAPDPERCLAGATVAEASRALARRGTVVLVGAWPPSCDRLAYDWDITMRRVAGDDPVAASVQLALLGGPAAEAVVTAATAGVGMVTAAAGLAAAADRPLVLLPEATLDRSLLEWVASAGLQEVTVVGGPPILGEAVVEQLTAAGLDAVRLDGGDAIGTALAVAAHRPSSRGSGVVVAPAVGGTEVTAAAVVAALDGAAVVLSGPQVDDRVAAWLAAARPATGWALGTALELPPAAVAAYGAHVG